MVAATAQLPPLNRSNSRGMGDTGNGRSIPVEFICPLSLEVMNDPVILASGQTYERAYIEKWLEHGHSSCPKTRQELPHTHLCPNVALKTLIIDWCRSHNVTLKPPNAVLSPSSKRALTPKNPATTVTADVADDFAADGKKLLPLMPRAAVQEEDAVSAKLASVWVEDSNAAEVNGSGGGRLPKESPQSVLERSNSLNVPTPAAAAAAVKAPGGLPSIALHPKSSSSNSLVASLEAASPARGIPPAFPSAGRSPFGGPSFPSVTRRGSADASSAAASPMLMSAKKLERTMSPRPQKASFLSDSASSSPAVSGSGAALDPWAAETKQDKSTDDAIGAYLAAGPGRNRGGGMGRRRMEVDDTPYSKRLMNTAVTRRNRRMSSDAAVCEIRPLVEWLETGSVEQRRDAAAGIRIALKDAPENRMRFVGAGGIQPLIMAMKSEDAQTVEHAVTAVLFLSIAVDGCTELVSNGAIRVVVDALRDAKMETASSNAAAAIFAMTGPEENKRLVYSAGAIQPLLKLLASKEARSKKDACLALYNLAGFEKAALEMLREGLVEKLVEILEEGDVSVEEKVVALMGALAKWAEGREAIVEEEDGIYCLVDVLEGGSDKAKEHAAITLLLLAKNDSSCIKLLLQEGCLPPLVKLATNGCDENTGKKIKAVPEAQKLLELLRESCKEKASGSTPSSRTASPLHPSLSPSPLHPSFRR